jgi:hypothetical protein
MSYFAITTVPRAAGDGRAAGLWPVVGLMETKELSPS